MLSDSMLLMMVDAAVIFSLPPRWRGRVRGKQDLMWIKDELRTKSKLSVARPCERIVGAQLSGHPIVEVGNGISHRSKYGIRPQRRQRILEEGVEIAAKLGYRYIEPMVHTGWELLSEVHYFHSFSMEEDPLLLKEICARNGLRVSSVSGHSPLMKPEAAVPRLTRAIVLADACGAVS